MPFASSSPFQALMVLVYLSLGFTTFLTTPSLLNAQWSSPTRERSEYPFRLSSALMTGDGVSNSTDEPSQHSRSEALVPALHVGVLEDLLVDEQTLLNPVGARNRYNPNPSRDLNPSEVRLVSWNQVQDNEDQESDPKPEEAAAEEKPRPAKIEEVIRQEQEKLKSDTQLDDIAKSERLTVLDNAAEWVQRADEYERKFERFKTDNTAFQANLKGIQESLKESDALPDLPELDPGLSSDQYQRLLQDVQSQLESQKSNLLALQNESRQFSERITELPKLKSQAEQRLKAVQEQLKGKAELETAVTDEKQLLQFAIRKGTEAELEMLRVESSYLENSAQLSPLRIDLANRQVKQLEAQVLQLNEGAELARNREVEQQIETARQAAMEAIPQLAEIAKGNEQLARQRKELAEQIAKINSEAKRVENQAIDVESELASLTDKVEKGAANASSLSETHQQLITPWESRFRLGELQESLQDVRLTVLKLKEERESLSDPDAFIESHLKIDPADSDFHAIQMAKEMVGSKKELLDTLLVDHRTYRRALSQTIAQREKLLKGLAETQTFLNKHMLWTQNTNSVRVKTLRKSGEGLNEFLSAQEWSGVGMRLVDRMMDRPHEYLLGGLGAVFLFVIVRRFKD